MDRCTFVIPKTRVKVDDGRCGNSHTHPSASVEDRVMVLNVENENEGENEDEKGVNRD